MKNFIINLNWVWDYYILYNMYNSKKIDRYHNYMSKKWGEKYEK